MAANSGKNRWKPGVTWEIETGEKGGLDTASQKPFKCHRCSKLGQKAIDRTEIHRKEQEKLCQFVALQSLKKNAC